MVNPVLADDRFSFELGFGNTDINVKPIYPQAMIKLGNNLPVYFASVNYHFQDNYQIGFKYQYHGFTTDLGWDFLNHDNLTIRERILFGGYSFVLSDLITIRPILGFSDWELEFKDYTNHATYTGNVFTLIGMTEMVDLGKTEYLYVKQGNNLFSSINIDIGVINISYQYGQYSFGSINSIQTGITLHF